jgi:DNA-binding winged helix-turn-helix (wHTH) protein/tetratricopeptide (TPR) repeat protein
MSAFSFGPFVLYPAERRLMRNGRGVAVPGKAWQILLMLAEAGGRLVSHQTLRARLWPDVVVEERTLTVHVSTLRKALDDGSPSDFIETVPREGYRLAVPVRVLSESTPVPPMAAGPPVLAVRPFTTGDLAEADTYLGVGIADAVTTELGALPGLTVSPVGAVADLTVARSLGVGHLLEGAVQRKAEQLHVSARLVDVASGAVQWSERFEHPVTDSVSLQDAIAKRVANSIAHSPNFDRGGLRSYRPRSSEAYFLQLRARANLKLYQRLPAVRALGLFERALALDPAYAMACAGLASTYLLLTSTVILRPLPVDEAMPLARESAERALALDEELAEAWAVLGRVKMEYDWDWIGAEADLAHAIALNPNSVEALDAYGQFLSAMGRHSEALETMDQALRLDPRRLETLWNLGFIYWMADEGDRALEAMGAAVSANPHATRGHFGRMLILDQLGRHDEAMAERLVWLKRQAPPQVDVADELARLHRGKGWRAAMVEWLGMRERSNGWLTAAMQWMALDERARALDILERCVSDRVTYLALAGRHPCFRALHDEPRFQRILQVLKLDDSTTPSARQLDPVSGGVHFEAGAGG